MPIDVTTFCKLLDLSPRRVQQLARDGIIPKPQRGCYEPQSVVNYIRYLRRVSESGETTLTEERTRLTKLQADLEEIKLRQQRSQYLDASKVQLLWSAQIAAAKARLLAIPNKSAPLISGLSPPEIKDKLDFFISEALEELAELTEEELEKRVETSEDDITDMEAASKADSVPMGRPKQNVEPGSKRRARKVDHSAR